MGLKTLDTPDRNVITLALTVAIRAYDDAALAYSVNLPELAAQFVLRAADARKLLARIVAPSARTRTVYS